jgi:hypothetical protein
VFLRAIVYLVLGYLVYRFVRRAMVMLSALRGNLPGPSGGPLSSKMVRCTQCGTFVAETRAMLVGNSAFCSSTCATQRSEAK